MLLLLFLFPIVQTHKATTQERLWCSLQEQSHHQNKLIKCLPIHYLLAGSGVLWWRGKCNLKLSFPFFSQNDQTILNKLITPQTDTEQQNKKKVKQQMQCEMSHSEIQR